MHQRGDLTRDSQLIYLSQWLGEFSEVEKDDFLQELLDLYAPGQLAIGQRLAPLKSEDKKATLFDCRIDLFKQWFASWELTDREECLARLKEADVEFMERFQKSKETPNEDKIVEEFWLRLDNGTSENNGTAAVVENGSARTQEKGSFEIRENGSATVQENGNATVQENGNATVQENGNSLHSGHEDPAIQDNAKTELHEVPVVRENGTTIELDEVSENLEQNVSNLKVEDEGKDIEAAQDLATTPSNESAGTPCQEEKDQAMKGTDEAVENES